MSLSCCSSLSFSCKPLLSSLPSHGLTPCSPLKTLRTRKRSSGIRPSFSESSRGSGRCGRAAAPAGSLNSRVLCGLLPTDPWSPNVDSQSVASQLFAVSLLPYLGFLYYITKSKTAPRLTLFGFYFLLAFVGATIPAGIYAKVHYGTSLSNVDWLHGGAESLLALTNLFIVLGLRGALRKIKDAKQAKTKPVPEVTENQSV